MSDPRTPSPLVAAGGDSVKPPGGGCLSPWPSPPVFLPELGKESPWSLARARTVPPPWGWQHPLPTARRVLQIPHLCLLALGCASSSPARLEPQTSTSSLPGWARAPLPWPHQRHVPWQADRAALAGQQEHADPALQGHSHGPLLVHRAARQHHRAAASGPGRAQRHAGCWRGHGWQPGGEAHCLAGRAGRRCWGCRSAWDVTKVLFWERVLPGVIPRDSAGGAAVAAREP